MLTNTDASMEMLRYYQNALTFMKKKGYILPSIIVMSKGEPIDIEVSHKGILEVGTNIEEDDFITPDKDEIYMYGISFKLNKDYDDAYLEEVARKIAEEYEPDCIGTVSACLLRDFPEDQRPKVEDIQKDPDVFRVIFLQYFLKGEEKPNFMLIPYTKDENEDPGWEEDRFSINTMPSSWNTGIDTDNLLMPNPYK